MGKAQVIPFGPQHPVLPEPLHLDLVVQDETVVDVLPQIGFVHRGLEKLVETRDIHQYIYVAERICGICAFGHSYGYAQTIENMMNVEVPERAEFLRVIMHELSRIHSHLLWMGLAADAFGYEALFMHCWRLRERILDIFETVAGGRVILSYTLLGGVAKDIEAPTLAAIKDTLNSLKKEYAEICNAFLKDSSVKNRTVGVGFVDEEHAREYGMVGPFARASNFNNDRIKVRANEVLQSIDIVNELIDKIPDGPILNPVKGAPEDGAEASSILEQPRGEVYYYAAGNGTKYLERMRIRTPTSQNIAGMTMALKGCEISDVNMIVLTIDPCISCTER